VVDPPWIDEEGVGDPLLALEKSPDTFSPLARGSTPWLVIGEDGE
jgi:hypothetical protein